MGQSMGCPEPEATSSTGEWLTVLASKTPKWRLRGDPKDNVDENSVEMRSTARQHYRTGKKR